MPPEDGGGAVTMRAPCAGNPGAQTPCTLSSPVAFLRDDTLWIVGWLAVLGLLIAAGTLAMQRRPDAARNAARGLVNLVIVTGASAAVITVGELAGDAYSNWIIGQSLHIHGSPSLVNAGEALLSVSPLGGGLVLLTIILALLSILACIVQIVLLVARIAMLGLLAGLLPVAAAASITQSGQAWFSKACSWLLAFLLYKPVAATVYAYALVSIGSNSLTDQVAGVTMIILSVVALPALLRFVTPLVGAAVGSGTGGAGAALAGAAVATGARMIPSFGSRGSSTPGPSGAPLAPGPPPTGPDPTDSQGPPDGGGAGPAAPDGPGDTAIAPDGASTGAGSAASGAEGAASAAGPASAAAGGAALAVAGPVGAGAQAAEGAATTVANLVQHAASQTGE